jgi:hypothetical protein
MGDLLGKTAPGNAGRWLLSPLQGRCPPPIADQTSRGFEIIVVKQRPKCYKDGMKTLLTASCLLLALGFTPAMGQSNDPVEEGLREAFKLHQRGDAAATAAKLRELVKLLEEKSNARVAGTLLPATIGDWKGEPVKRDDLAFLGGGTSLSRTYADGGKKLTVKVVKDSPLAKQLAAFLLNETLVAASGRKTHSISGKTAVQEGERKLQMVLEQDILLEVEGGENADARDLVALARKLDLRALARMQETPAAE